MLLRQHLTDAGRGAIVNVSSLAGVLGLSGSSGAVPHTTAKAGLQGFTLSVTTAYAAEHPRQLPDRRDGQRPPGHHLGAEALERRGKAVPLQTDGRWRTRQSNLLAIRQRPHRGGVIGMDWLPISSSLGPPVPLCLLRPRG
jgi:hypothetical protein